MSKVRIMFASLLAVFAVGAVASSSASAIGWWNESGAITKSVPLSSASKELKGHILYHKKEIEITCSKIKINGGALEPTTTGKATSVEFLSCTVLKPAKEGCEVVTGKITTGAISATLTGPPAEVTFKPTGTSFATFKLSEGCGVLAGEYVVKGETKAKIEEPEVCKKSHKIVISEKPSKLTVAGEAVEEFLLETEIEVTEGCIDAK